MTRRGFALLAALWLLVALSTASLALAAVAHARRLAAANLAEGERARGAAQAGVEQVRARLADHLQRDGRPDPWAGVDSLGDSLTLDGTRAAVSLRDVGTALNLNRADDDELRRLFVALRIDAGEADRLAQAIADWRDPDDLQRPRGAERDAYLAAGAVTLPRNGPFQTLDELRDVRGMSSSLFDRVRPYLTLLGSGQINVNAADRPVLLTLPGITEEAVGVLLRHRQERRPLGSITDLERDLSPGARVAFTAQLPALLARATTETREVEVTSEGAIPGSPARAKVTELLVRARGAVFRVWRRIE